MSMRTIVAGIATACAIVFPLQAFSQPGPSDPRTEWYVSPHGNDFNNGGPNDPFKTLNRAARAVNLNDRVNIASGTYRETLTFVTGGSYYDSIVWRPDPREHSARVIISAMDSLPLPGNSWVHTGHGIYKTAVNPSDFGSQTDQDFNLVIAKSASRGTNRALHLARWPNHDGTDFVMGGFRSTGGSGAVNGVITHPAYIDYSPGIPNFNTADASVRFYGDATGAGWLTWGAKIDSKTNTRLNMDLRNKNRDFIFNHLPASGGEFFIEGALELLDNDWEWYLDKVANELYVKLPGGRMPDHGEIEMRTRTKTVDFNGKRFNILRELAVFGGEIMMNGGWNTLHKVSSFYGNTRRGVGDGYFTWSNSVLVQGQENFIHDCEIGFGSGSGIWDMGYKTRIDGNYIHDFNLVGDYNAPIMGRSGNGESRVHNNTIQRAGRDGIQWINPKSRINGNDVSQTSMFIDDSGAFYTTGDASRAPGQGKLEGQETWVNHNWFHDAYNRRIKAGTNENYLHKAAGIYLDSSTANFKVFHNIVSNVEWNSIQMNWNAVNIHIHHNTLWNSGFDPDPARGTIFNDGKNMGHWRRVAGRDGAIVDDRVVDVYVKNNLTNNAGNPEWDGDRVGTRNLVLPNNSQPFVNIWSFIVDPNSGVSPNPVNYGEGHKHTHSSWLWGPYYDVNGNRGDVPDAGATEWYHDFDIGKTGVGWTIGLGPAERCYGLVGEYCHH